MEPVFDDCSTPNFDVSVKNKFRLTFFMNQYFAIINYEQEKYEQLLQLIGIDFKRYTPTLRTILAADFYDYGNYCKSFT